jgi:hypothetical protein
VNSKPGSDTHNEVKIVDKSYLQQNFKTDNIANYESLMQLRLVLLTQHFQGPKIPFVYRGSAFYLLLLTV